MALSVAMSASTRLPMPVVSVSDNCETKLDWIENFFAPLDSLASAASTLLSEGSTGEITVQAESCVEIEADLPMVTMLPLRLMFSEATVMRCEPSADARAEMPPVDEPSIRLKPLKLAF